MESNILNLLGLGNIDPAIFILALLALVLILLLIVIIQGCKISKVSKKFNKFMTGKDAKSLEDEIVDLFHENKMIRAENDKNRKDIQDINKRMQRTFQKGQHTGGRPGPGPLPEAPDFLPEAALTQTRQACLSGLGVGEGHSMCKDLRGRRQQREEASVTGALGGRCVQGNKAPEPGV